MNGLFVFFSLAGLGVYLWAEVLGSFSLVRGLRALGGLLLLGLIAVTLPTNRSWGRLAKFMVITGSAVWVVSQMLHIETSTEWTFSIVLAVVFGIFGYVVLFR